MPALLSGYRRRPRMSGIAIWCGISEASIAAYPVRKHPAYAGQVLVEVSSPLPRSREPRDGSLPRAGFAGVPCVIVAWLAYWLAIIFTMNSSICHDLLVRTFERAKVSHGPRSEARFGIRLNPGHGCALEFLCRVEAKRQRLGLF